MSLYWYPVVCCRPNGVITTTTLQSQAFLRNIHYHSKTGRFLVCWKPVFRSFFQNALISRPYKILTWNQFQLATNILNFHNMKRASIFLQPFSFFCNSKTGLNFTRIFDDFEISWFRLIKLSMVWYSFTIGNTKLLSFWLWPTLVNIYIWLWNWQRVSLEILLYDMKGLLFFKSSHCEIDHQIKSKLHIFCLVRPLWL